MGARVDRAWLMAASPYGACGVWRLRRMAPAAYGGFAVWLIVNGCFAVWLKRRVLRSLGNWGIGELGTSPRPSHCQGGSGMGRWAITGDCPQPFSANCQLGGQKPILYGFDVEKCLPDFRPGYMIYNRSPIS